MIAGYDNGGEDLSETLKVLLTVANSGFTLFNSSKTAVKRELLFLLFSNLQIVRLHIKWHKNSAALRESPLTFC